MALTTFNPRSFDLSDTYAFTGTVSGTNVGGGNLVKISEQTASASSSISFTSGIDSTYRTYCFRFNDIHSSNDNVYFRFQGSTNGGSSYGVTTTTTHFKAYQSESATNPTLAYQTADDLAQSTSYINLAQGMGTDNDQQTSGELWLFNPSSTTYVKHFMARMENYQTSDYAQDLYTAGYLNTTSAINAIDFEMGIGNIDDGTITMYGIA